MTSGSGKPRSIEIELRVDAPEEAAWRAISRGEEMARWFSPEARIEPGEGGSVWLSWGEGMEGEAPVDLWEEGRRIRWVEEMPAPGEEGETVPLAVELSVEGREGDTTIRLVHSGFTEDAGWDEYFDGLLTGWSYFMRHLKLYLERHLGTPRQMISVRRAPGMSPEDAWAALMGPGGLDVPQALSDAPPGDGDPFSLRLEGKEGEPLRGEAWMVKPGKAFAGVLPGLDDAPLFVEFEGTTGDWKCGVWLSTYGLPEPRVAELREALARRVEGAFGGG